MIQHEPLVLVVVQHRAVELGGGAGVQGEGNTLDLQAQVAVDGAAGSGEAEAHGAAAASEGDPQDLPRAEVAEGGGAGFGSEGKSERAKHGKRVALEILRPLAPGDRFRRFRQ